ncbi:MAG TPA: hypothetical protein VF469_12400 [Kofleriaceae bacterium]
MSRKAARSPGRPLVLVFGESEHDSRAIKALVAGLAPGLKHSVEHRRQPLVLIKNALPKKARSNAEKIADLARIEGRVRRVLAVLAHEDCDAIEPEHLEVADRIESELRSVGCPNPIAVTPAWEIEAWWLIFPEAVGKLVEGWREPSDWLGRDVGRLKDAKEQLSRAVQPRPAGRSSPRAYHERDSIEIAQNIVADGLLTSFADGRRSTRHAGGSLKHTRSGSFEQFRQKVLRIAASLASRA